MAASRLAGADRLPELRPDYLNTSRTRLNPVRGQHVSGLLVSLSLTEVMHLGRVLAIDPRPCRGDRDFDAVDLVRAPLSSEHFDQREAGQVDQRIEKLSGLVPATTSAGSGPSAKPPPSSSPCSACTTGRPTIPFLLNLAR
jgi:hypothetical protein